MYLEERVKQLEEQNRALEDRVKMLEAVSSARFATVAELAEIMHCSVQTVHNKIRNGDILVTRKLGDPRIPLAQFLEATPRPIKKSTKSLTMEEQIFGSAG